MKLNLWTIFGIVCSPMILVGTTASSPALANDWILVGASNDGTQAFVNATSIKRSDDRSTVYFIEQFSDQNKSDSGSISIHVVATCPAKRYAVIRRAVYDKDDNLTQSTNYGSKASMQAVKPNSLMEGAVHYACNGHVDD